MQVDHTFEIIFDIPSEQMFCATCSNTIKGLIQGYLSEKKQKYEYVATHLATHTASVEIDLDNYATAEILAENLQTSLKTVGYDCCKYSIFDLDEKRHGATQQIPETKSTLQKELLLASAFFGLGSALMVTEHMDWLPSPRNSRGIIVDVGVGVVATTITGILGKDRFMTAWRSLGKPSGAMDSLISLASIAALLFSFLVLGLPSIFADGSMMTYFSLPIVLLSLLKISHVIRNRQQANIEAHVDAIISTRRILPATANVALLITEEKLKQLTEKEVTDKLEEQAVKRITQGSILFIAKDEIVSIDGVLLNDMTTVKESFFGKDEATLKTYNQIIYAGSKNISSQPIILRTVVTAKDNQIIKALHNIKNSTDEDSQSLEPITRYFFYLIILIAVISAAGWGLLGPEPKMRYGSEVFFTELFCACPCFLGLIKMILSVNKALAFAHGILIKSDQVLALDKVTDIILDKCGTVTKGEYRVTDVALDEKKQDLHLAQEQKKKFLAYACVAEQQEDAKQRSGVGAAMLDKVTDPAWHLDLSAYRCTEFHTNPFNPGRGSTAVINDQQIVIGNKPFLQSQKISIDSKWSELAQKLAQKQQLGIYLAVNQVVCAMIVLESQEEKYQTLRPETESVIEWLQQHGKTIHFLTGDSRERTVALIEHLSPSVRRAIVLQTEKNPQDKEDYIKSLQDEDKNVLMIGDGYNDLRALKTANISGAIDNLAPARLQADFVLNGDLTGIIKLISLSTIHQRAQRSSYIIAFGINAVDILCAAGLLYPWTKQLLDPIITSSSMIASSIFLMLNIAYFKRRAKQQLNNPYHFLAAKIDNNQSLEDDLEESLLSRRNIMIPC